MTISRQVGTLQECYPVFIQDATVSTGLGLPNLTISTFSSYYYRSDMTSTSSVTLVSTGTLGTWSSGQFLQINSTFMRGWYQFCLPNGIFAAGSTCAIHLYGHPSMAPAPILIDITRFNNQGWVSSQPHNITRAYSDVLLTSAAGVLTVDVSTILRSIPVTSFAGVLTANVSTIHGSRAVTSAAGVLAVDVSSIQRGSAATSAAGILSVNVSTIQTTNALTSAAGILTVNVSTLYGSNILTSFAGVQTVNVSTIHGSRAVTTAAGILLAGPVGVSSVTDKEGYSVTSMNVGVNVTSVRGTTAVTTVAGYFPTHFDLELTRNVNSTVAFSSVSWSTQSVSVGSVDVTSFYGSAVVTTEAGVVATALDFGRTANVNSTVAFSSVSWSTQSVSVGSVDVTSFYGSGLVTTAAGRLAVGPVGVSSVTDKAGYGVSSFQASIDVSSIYGTAFITSAAGVPSVNVSTLLGSKVLTSFAGVQTVNVSTLHGSRWVTTAAGVIAVDPVGVSSVTDKAGYSVTSMNVGVNVTSVRGTTAVTTVAGYFPSHFDLELTRNVNSTVAFSSVSWSTQSVTVGSVDVTSFYGSGLVTTAAGRLAVGRVGVSSMDIGVSVTTMGTGVGVTTMGIGVGVTTLSVPVDVTSFYGSGSITSAAGVLASHVTSMRIAVDRQIADGLLGRNIAGGSDGGRTLTEAVYVLRNRTEISAGVLTVYGTDDATSSWEANVTTTAGNPISQIDPS